MFDHKKYKVSLEKLGRGWTVAEYLRRGIPSNVVAVVVIDELGHKRTVKVTK